VFKNTHKLGPRKTLNANKWRMQTWSYALILTIGPWRVHMILLQRAEFVILTYPMYISFVNIAAQPEWTILPFCAPTVTSKRSNARNIQPYATNSTRTGKNIGLIKELSSMTPKNALLLGLDTWVGILLIPSFKNWKQNHLTIWRFNRQAWTYGSGSLYLALFIVLC
jgi:hypothetical protein